MHEITLHTNPMPCGSGALKRGSGASGRIRYTIPIEVCNLRKFGAAGYATIRAGAALARASLLQEGA